MKQEITNKENTNLPGKSILANGGFKHVSYLWDEAKASGFSGDEVGLLEQIMAVAIRHARPWQKILLQENKQK